MDRSGTYNPSEPPDRPGFVERVLDVVARIPAGKVMSYGDIAEYLGEGGPRQVAKVMSTYGEEVPWHRVLRSNGTCADQIATRQLSLLRNEPVVFDPTRTRVRMAESRWLGDDPVGEAAEHAERVSSRPGSVRPSGSTVRRKRNTSR